MRTFRYFPPSVEEQRGFIMQLCGTLLSLLVIAVFVWRTESPQLRYTLIGAGAGVLWLLARSAWKLEQKARRSQNAEFVVDEKALQITDAKGATQRVLWDEIEGTEVVGGRLALRWSNGEINIGAREIENGMELIQLIAARGQSTRDPHASSNFISLEPK